MNIPEQNMAARVNNSSNDHLLINRSTNNIKSMNANKAIVVYLTYPSEKNSSNVNNACTIIKMYVFFIIIPHKLNSSYVYNILA